MNSLMDRYLLFHNGCRLHSVLSDDVIHATVIGCSIRSCRTQQDSSAFDNRILVRLNGFLCVRCFEIGCSRRLTLFFEEKGETSILVFIIKNLCGLAKFIGAVGVAKVYGLTAFEVNRIVWLC